MPVRDPGPAEMMTVQFVDSQKKVVSILEFEMGQVRPSKRRSSPRCFGQKGSW